MWFRSMTRSARRQLRALAGDTEGGALVEFAVLAPLLFTIMFGVIEWGHVFYVQNNMLIAARQGARNWAYATTIPTGGAAAAATADITAICSATGAPLKGTGTYTFTMTYYGGCTATWTASSVWTPSSPFYGTVTIKIATSAAKASIINYLGMLGASTTNLTASATLQEEFVCPAAGPLTYSPAAMTC